MGGIGSGECKMISLEPTKTLGCLCGLILGDGWIFKAKTRNYGVGLESSDHELISAFLSALKKAFPNLRPFIQNRKKTRCFPNGKKCNTPTQVVTTYSKRLYEALLPFKQEDFRWDIPTFLTTTESLIGFLQGIFDAEGGVHRPTKDRRLPSVRLYSKQKENLTQVQIVLAEFGIKSRTSRNRNQWTLEIGSGDTFKIFKNLINFNLPRKRETLLSYYCESMEIEEVKNT